MFLNKPLPSLAPFGGEPVSLSRFELLKLCLLSHSKRRTNRDFRPNVQRKRLLIGNELVRVHVCTRCMRTAQKSGK